MVSPSTMRTTAQSSVWADAEARTSGRKSSGSHRRRGTTRPRCHSERTGVNNWVQPSGLERELLDAEHCVAERPELGVDERLMAPLGATPLDVALTVRYAPITTRSAIQEHLDIFLGRELPLQVFAQACLVARDDEIVSSENRHTTIFHDSRGRSRSAKPSEGAPFPPGFFGKPARIASLFPRGFRKLGAGLFGPKLRRIGRVVRGVGARPLLRQATLGPSRPLGPRYNQSVQKPLRCEDSRPGPTGRVLDPAVGADDDRTTLPLPRQAHELVVGSVGWAREDHADPPR